MSPSGKTVIKFPNCKEGVDANWSERFVYTGKANTINMTGDGTRKIAKNKLAGCRMIGPNLLIMTKVNIDTITDEWIEFDAPAWVKTIDCGQVGYHPRTGKLVAFDYTSF